MPELTAQPAIEDEERTQKLKGSGSKQPCGRVVGIVRRHWREKQYCGSLRNEGDRAVASGKGQATSALFMPVDRKVSRSGYDMIRNTPFLQRLPLSLQPSVRKLSQQRRDHSRCIAKYSSNPLVSLYVLCLQIPWVRIQTRQREVLSSKRILVAMDSWPPWCKYPLGHYVKTLGEKGAKATETEVGTCAVVCAPKVGFFARARSVDQPT